MMGKKFCGDQLPKGRRPGDCESWMNRHGLEEAEIGILTAWLAQGESPKPVGEGQQL